MLPQVKRVLKVVEDDNTQVVYFFADHDLAICFSLYGRLRYLPDFRNKWVLQIDERHDMADIKALMKSIQDGGEEVRAKVIEEATPLLNDVEYVPIGIRRGSDPLAIIIGFPNLFVIGEELANRAAEMDHDLADDEGFTV